MDVRCLPQPKVNPIKEVNINMIKIRNLLAAVSCQIFVQDVFIVGQNLCV